MSLESTFRALCVELVNDLDRWCNDWTPASYHDPRISLRLIADRARAALARWGSTIPRPIPVTERPPGVDDRTTDQECWWWDTISGSWFFLPGDPLNDHYSHWLPAHSLPLPEAKE